MADGDVTVKFEGKMAQRLRAGAAAAGQTVQDYATGLIAEGLDADWAEDLDRIARYERSGESLSVEETLAFFDRELEKRLAERR